MYGTSCTDLLVAAAVSHTHCTPHLWGHSQIVYLCGTHSDVDVLRAAKEGGTGAGESATPIRCRRGGACENVVMTCLSPFSVSRRSDQGY